MYLDIGGSEQKGKNFVQLAMRQRCDYDNLFG